MRGLVITTAVLGFAVGLSLSAYQVQLAHRTRASMSLSGTWTLSLNGRQGAITIPVTLDQRGASIIGTMSDSVAGDLQVAGEVAGRALTFSTSALGQSGAITLHFTGQLNDDGTLSGTVSAPTGEVAWAARRATGQNATRPVQHRAPPVQSS